MAEKHQSVMITIPNGYDSETRMSIGTEIVNFIIARTDRGLDQYNRPFRNYSLGYSKSTEFKAAAKSRNSPNLRLSGELHSSLQVLGHGPGYIKIGFEPGSEENDKAAWAASSDRGGREMLGIMPKDLQGILSGYPLPSSESTNLLTSFANEVLRRVIQ